MKQISSFLVLVLLIFDSSAVAQKAITLEDIWRDFTFSPSTLPGFTFQNDGQHFTRKIDNQVQQFDLLTGHTTAVLLNAAELTGNPAFKGRFDDYSFSSDESKILLKTETEAIYRHSTKANFFVWDRGKNELQMIFDEGKQRYASFSPDADKVAFVFQNNMFFKELETGKVIQITKDGAQNQIINGATDWVYEEEFSFAKAFQWSPDSRRIAYMRFDETEVREFTLTKYHNQSYPEYITFKYPKVGEKNSKVRIFIYDIESGTTTEAETGTDNDQYFPRLLWTRDPNTLCILKMNRHQNELELLLTNAATGQTTTLLKESNPYYIDIDDDLTFLPDGERFIWTSEQSGYNHIYLYDLKGKLCRQLTTGNYDVTGFYGYDDKRNVIYYQAAASSPLERQVYSVDLEGGSPKLLTLAAGTNEVQFSSNYDFFINTYSTSDRPPIYTVHNNAGKAVRIIEDNERIISLAKGHGVSPVEFFNFKTSENVSLNGWMIKPPGFRPDRQYPCLMYVYGGPGSQTVRNRWIGQNYWWFQMLAQNGYVIASVDNRGTGARGEEFKKITYLQLGKYETIDQIEAARFLGGQSYIDASRIGMFGWSYGGYMSSLCLLKGNDVFKSAIAVAPVTNWKWYDTIYTERYMRTRKENEEGYEENSPVNFADRLQGHYLLVHGEADDNVHFQNAAEMANALIKANKQFDTYFYPNRNHGIYGDNARLHLFTKMTNFILEKL